MTFLMSLNINDLLGHGKQKNNTYVQGFHNKYEKTKHGNKVNASEIKDACRTH